MYNLIITELAHEDLDEIVRYIAIDLNAPKAASDFVDAVDACYKDIRTNPGMFEYSRDSRLRQEGYRRAVVKNYIFLYKVFEEKNEVVIYRLIYGRRNYANLI